MKSDVLVTQIVRLIETDGAIGDGAQLSSLYAEAVNAVNGRLDSVVGSIESKQISDAVRVMEMQPRLIDEINALDFPRLADWETYCKRNRWTNPPTLDRRQIDRVLLLNESAESVETFLKMYRRAVRMKDNRLAVQSLRNLIEKDNSQDWQANLQQAEQKLQADYEKQFADALKAGKGDEAEKTAREFLLENWLEVPDAAYVREMRALVDKADADALNAEGEKHIAALRECFDVSWNRKVVLSVLESVKSVAESGWTPSGDGAALIEACRTRCENEAAQEEFDGRWKKRCEALHSYVEKEDVGGIRDALSVPEFLDREPPEDLLRSAQIVVSHDDARRRRKAVQRTVVAVLGLLALLGVSAWLLKIKMLKDRCEAEVARLTALESEANPIEQISAEIARLKRDEPEVFNDAGVGAFTGRLETMIAENAVRTNEIVSLIVELGGLMNGEWKDSVYDTTTNKLARVKELIKPWDTAYNKQRREILSSWNDFCDQNDTALRKNAEQFFEILTSRMKAAAKKLSTEYSWDDMDSEIAAIDTDIEKWAKTFAESAADLDSDLDTVKKDYLEAKDRQQKLKELISRMKNERDAVEITALRASLKQFYDDYRIVAELDVSPVSKEDVSALIAGETNEMTAFKNRMQAGISDGEFKEFVKDTVTSYRDYPAFYSLYGIYSTANRNGKAVKNQLLAISKDRPSIDIKFNAPTEITGDLYEFTPGHMGEARPDGITCPNGTREHEAFLMAPAAEIKDLVEYGERAGLSLNGFERFIIDRIAHHIEEGHDAKYYENEIKSDRRFVEKDCIPAYRRVQFLAEYFGWLQNDLKVLPEINDAPAIIANLNSLAQPMHVGEMPDELTWTCLYDSRVSSRNLACAKFLYNTIPADFVARYKEAVEARRALSEFCKFKIASAGKIMFNPESQFFRKNHKSILPSVNEDVEADHPLYVLRNDGGKLLLKKAFVPGSDPDKKSWLIASKEIKENFIIGEPLFQVVLNGKAVDAEKSLNEIFSASPNSAKAYSEKIPYFNMEVK